MRYKYCSNCGTRVSINSKFCPKCGHTLDFNQASKSKSKVESSIDNSHYGKWIIGIIAVLVIFIIAMPIFNGSSHNSNNDNTSHQTQSNNSSNINQIHSYEYNDVVSPMWESVEGTLIDTEAGDQSSSDSNREYNSLEGYFADGKHNPSARALINWIKSTIPEAKANKKAYEGASVSNFSPSGNKATMRVHYEEQVNTTGKMNGTMETQDQVYVWIATFDKHTHLIKSLKKHSKPLSQSIKKEHKTKAEKEGIP